DGGSWTNSISWVKGYDDVMSAMERASAHFNEAVLKPGQPTHEDRYRKALFYLLTSQTSCYRYWGQGMWTDYGQELCRRVEEIIRHDYAS
ncbi:MAG: glycosyl hydrolase family 57, partial [Rhodospirillales bacterium]